MQWLVKNRDPREAVHMKVWQYNMKIRDPREAVHKFIGRLCLDYFLIFSNFFLGKQYNMILDYAK
jgi:hypothetical protein